MKIKQLLSTAVTAVVMTSAMVGVFADTARAANHLRVYDWAGYDNPAYYKSYMDKYKKKPTFSLFAEEEEARAKMVAGFKSDISHPCGYSADRWRNSGLLQPIDVSKLKNYKDIPAVYAKQPGYVVDGKVYIIPYDIGQTALTYNADKVPASDVKSLQVFIDPKYKGRVSLPDNFSDWISLGFVATGTRDWSTIKSQSDPKYQKALDFLRKAHKNNKFYWTDGPNLASGMKTGEVLITWAWNETPVTLRGEGLNIKMNRDTKEGMASFVCGYVWLKTSSAKPEQVYDFFDSLISRETTLPLVTEFGYAHSNGVGMKNLSKEVLDASVVSDSEKYAKKALFQTPLADDVVKFMNDDFNKIKSGN